MSALADAVFRHMNDLATVSYAGYREVRARTAEAQQAAGRRLLQLTLDRDDPVPLRALADLAEVACWPAGHPGRQQVWGPGHGAVRAHA